MISDLIKLIRIAFSPVTCPMMKKRRHRRWSLRMVRLSWLTGLLCALLLGGCINLYTRCPGTDPKIDYCYQSTDTAAMMTVVASFPQIMATMDTKGPEWYNIFTVTLLGIPFLADTICEAAIDTVLLPIDYAITR